VELHWVDGTVDVRCPVCGRTSGQQRLASAAIDWRDDPVEIARCGDCGAVVMSAVLPPSSYSEAAWDLYVEQIAGIETIDAALAKLRAPAGANVLDIGCGYGFSLDMANRCFGWRGIGLDPSIAAERGRRELQLDIRDGTLDDAFEPDERFDVILAIEVLEHVDDPRSFLESVRRRLAPDGVLLLTTPDASCVRPETPMTTLYPALSIGGHQFLVDEHGLRALLERSGFVAQVEREQATLWGLGAPTAAALRSTDLHAPTDMLGLVDYCESRGEEAPSGSALAVGMASRHLKFAMAANAFRRAVAGLPRLRVALRERYGMDLDDPASVLTHTDPPAVLVVADYYVGLLALLLDRDLARAAQHFAAAAAVSKSQYAMFGVYRDPESPALEIQALSYRVEILARCDPAAAPAALADLEQAAERTGTDEHEIARARARAVHALATTWQSRLRFGVGRRKRATEHRFRHWQRKVQQRRARRRRAPDASRGHSSRGHS